MERSEKARNEINDKTADLNGAALIALCSSEQNKCKVMMVKVTQYSEVGVR